MKIAVIGRGSIGRTLAEKDHRRSRGHLRRPRPGDQRTAAIPEAVTAAEVVLLAIPGQPRRISSSTSARRCRARSSSATNDVGSGKLGALDELAAGAGS